MKRRTVIQTAAVLASASALSCSRTRGTAARHASTVSVPNSRGHYSFIRGIAPYSGGAAASDGYEIEHATIRRPAPLDEGFSVIERHLAARNLPKQALCGLELRSPRPFTFRGFNDFNAGYIDVLRKWDVLVEGGLNPVARTNVAPEVHPPAQPSVYGFSYVVASAGAPRSFVLAGSGELPEGSLDARDVVRSGETSPEAIAEKARFVVDRMAGRLAGLGVSWADVTAIDVYTVHDMWPFLVAGLLKPCAANAVVWHYARPPIEGLEFEMDARGVRREIVLG